MLSGHQQIEISCSSEPPKPPKIDFRFENCECRLQIEAGNLYIGAGSDVSCRVKYQNRLKTQGKRQICRTNPHDISKSNKKIAIFKVKLNRFRPWRKGKFKIGFLQGSDRTSQKCGLFV